MNIEAFNYYKTANQKSRVKLYSTVYSVKTYRGVQYGELTSSSDAMVFDGVIISERVRIGKAEIDAFLDGLPDAGLDYHARVRPLECLKKAKLFAEDNR